jgi:hypothetical protein
MLPEEFSEEGGPRRVARIPHDTCNDLPERKALHLLMQHIDSTFFPNPLSINLRVGSEERMVVSCDYISSPYISRIPSTAIFRTHLDNALPTLDEKVDYLRNLRTFLDQTKEFYYATHSLADIAGQGNLIPYESSLYLLDFNNIGIEEELIKPGHIHVPLDENGFPIFDLSLRIIYNLEKHLLTAMGTNFASQDFSKICYHDNDMDFGSIFSLGMFRHREELKHERFYGALRFKARRDAVDNIMSRINQYPI